MATAKYSRYEYNATTSISRANIGDMSRAQEAFINYWKGKVSKAALTSGNEWEKNEVLRVAEEGDSQINKLLRIFNDNKAYISITFRVNYLAFKNLATGNTDFTIVQGNIIPIRVLTSSGGSIPL
ncbi:hypothetical protein [Lysinibacillus tabacifolii]|uniref:Uncharacterized protein n=1 Tax=Lysinibacillus tabacifolii TaxID=1173107 RepID=A0ABY2T337_9BACI|nr:hypothetical protein [Lysinibacillus tabacifolii]TKI50232.1 hypothetical protein FC748_03180 [Lysinibacillus tabacifolii]